MCFVNDILCTDIHVPCSGGIFAIHFPERYIYMLINMLKMHKELFFLFDSLVV